MLGTALGVRRPDVIVATKVRGRMGDGPNQIGLSRVHIMAECDASLRRLGTDYIDLYQIHGHDPDTDIAETLGALNDLVRAGKVRYIGCSNLTAWQLMKALAVSRQQGLAEFISTQSYYSIAGRELEREMIPLVDDQGLGLLPWSPLAGGFLSGKFTRESETDPDARRTTFDFPPVDKTRAYDIIDVMRDVATAHEVSVAQIALAWLLHQPAVTSVIIGAKRLDQLDDNLGSVDLTLTDPELERLNTVSALAPEYPGWMQILQADRAPGTTRNWDKYVK
jgi:aryl-alcohol dehydrogenase-like predicted oxidoreductase